MSTTTPPISLASGQQAQLVQPGGGQYGNVVVANTSQFELTVQIGADTFDLQPFTAMLYPLQPSQQAPVNLNPYLPAGATFVAGQPNQVSATWYRYGEKPTGQWPFSFVGQAIQTGINGAINVQSQFTAVTLFSQGLAPGASDPVPNAGLYASVNVRMRNVVAGQLCVLTVFWYVDAAMTQLIAGDNFTLGQLGSAIMDDAWEMPVRGAFMQVVARPQSQGNFTVTVEGTNRSVPGIRQVLTTVLPRSFSYTGTLTANTPVNLTNSDGLGDYSSLNGECFATLTMINADVAGSVLAQFVAYNATLGNIFPIISLTAASTIAVPALFNHPNIPLTWQYFPTAGSGGTVVTINLNITPTGL